MTIHRNDAAPPPDSESESDEQYVREVIERAISSAQPRHDLGSVALARGRRLRTRRRVTVASVAAAVSILAVASAPFVLGGGGSAGTGGGLIATQPPAPEPALVQAPSGFWDMPAAEMVSAVRAILPDGVTVTDPGPLAADTAEGGPAHGWINAQLRSVTGPGRLNVILSPARVLTSCSDCHRADDGTVPTPSGAPDDEAEIADAGSDVDISCRAELSGRTDCTELRDDQGNVVGRRLVNHWSGTVIREVVLRRAGGTVYAASANTLDDKWSSDSPVSADRPPLTLDDLENLVRNDVWVSYQP